MDERCRCIFDAMRCGRCGAKGWMERVTTPKSVRVMRDHTAIPGAVDVDTPVFVQGVYGRQGGRGRGEGSETAKRRWGGGGEPGQTRIMRMTNEESCRKDSPRHAIIRLYSVPFSDSRQNPAGHARSAVC